MNALAPNAPTFADQVLAVDVLALAQRIQQQGSRAAIQASTVEILAMAVQITDLTPIVSNVFSLLVTADRLHDATAEPTKRRLREIVKRQISEIADALTALGYGKPTTNEEKSNG